jgi:hypothetical protein
MSAKNHVLKKVGRGKGLQLCWLKEEAIERKRLSDLDNNVPRTQEFFNGQRGPWPKFDIVLQTWQQIFGA